MKWNKINPGTDLIELIGVHVLIKGRNINTNQIFYATGYIQSYSGSFILEREEDRERGYIDCVRGFSDHCEYWMIDIDKIK